MLVRRALVVSFLALAACATPEALEAPVAAPTVDVSAYLGKSPDALEPVLGEPALVRAEGLGAFRRYDGAECSVFVLIGKGEGESAVISQIEAGARQPGGDAPEPGACMAAIAAGV